MVITYSSYVVLQGTITGDGIIVHSLNGLTDKETKNLSKFSYNGSCLVYPNVNRFIAEKFEGSDIELLVKVNMKVHHGVYIYNMIVYKARKPKCIYGLKRFSFAMRRSFTNERFD